MTGNLKKKKRRRKKKLMELKVMYLCLLLFLKIYNCSEETVAETETCTSSPSSSLSLSNNKIKKIIASKSKKPSKTNAKK